MTDRARKHWLRTALRFQFRIEMFRLKHQKWQFVLQRSVAHCEAQPVNQWSIRMGLLILIDVVNNRKAAIESN